MFGCRLLRFFLGVTFTILTTSVVADQPTIGDGYNTSNKVCFGSLSTLNSFIKTAAKEERIAVALSKYVTVLLETRKQVRQWRKLLSKRKLITTGAKLITTASIHKKFLVALERQNHPIVAKVKARVHNLLEVRRERSVGASWGTPQQSKWPGLMEMFMSKNGFLDVQKVYGLAPEDVIQGPALDTFNRGTLLLRHAMEMGMFALSRNQYYSAVEWLEATLKMETRTEETVGELIPQTLLILAVQTHNRVWRNASLGGLDYDKYMETFLTPVTLNGKTIERISRRQLSYQKFQVGEVTEPNVLEEAQFMNLCITAHAGPPFPGRRDNLKCFYENKRHPYLILAPVKTELLSASPPLFQYYDMIGNGTIERLKAVYDPLANATRMYEKNDFEWITRIRTTVSADVHQGDILQAAFAVMEMVSGIKIRVAREPGRYTAYSYGRYITMHNDNDFHEEHGERLATLIYYLETPELGGHTVFAQSSVHAWPVRNSAILWLNVYRNGKSRQDVDHASCPVIHGQKIIINQWIRYLDNWKHQCSLNKND